MPRTTVKALDEETFEVTVENGATTTHRVEAKADYVREIAGDKALAEELVERSFAFLLEREPNTSILRQFELSVIESYFPEYRREMARAFGG